MEGYKGEDTKKEEEKKSTLDEFARINTNIEESDFLKRKKQEIEDNERRVQENIVTEIVSKTVNQKELLDKRLNLIDPNEDKIELIKTLKDIQEAILQNLENVKESKKSNVLTKKIQEQEVADLYGFLLEFEDLKNQITYAVIDFKQNLETEIEQIDGRVEPYLISSSISELIIQLLSKLDSKLEKHDFLKELRGKLSNIKKILENPDNPLSKKFQKQVETDSEIVEEKVEGVDSGKINLKKLQEGKESAGRMSVEVIFEKRIEIQPASIKPVESLLEECKFDDLEGEIDSGTDFHRLSFNSKIISFKEGTTAEEMKKTMLRNGLRFLSTREILALWNKCRGSITKKIKKRNKKTEHFHDDKITSIIKTFDKDKELSIGEFPRMKRNFFGNDVANFYISSLFSKKVDHRHCYGGSFYYAVTDISGIDLLEDETVSVDDLSEIKKIEIDGKIWEMGPVLGKISKSENTTKQAKVLLKNANSSLRPGKKPWRFLTKSDFLSLENSRQLILQDKDLSKDQKEMKIKTLFSVLNFIDGKKYYRKKDFIEDFTNYGILFIRSDFQWVRFSKDEEAIVRCIR